MRRVFNQQLLRVALCSAVVPTSVPSAIASPSSSVVTSGSSYRFYSLAFSPSALRLQSEGDFDDLGTFDASSALQQEAKYVSRGSLVEDVVRQWLPSNAGEDLRAKLRKHLHANPLNDMITSTNNITVTHLENDKGEEVNRVPGVLQDENGKNRQFTHESAVRLAQSYEGKYLVQVAENNGTSYCRIRDEKKRFLRTVADEVATLERALGGSSGQGGGQQKRVQKIRDTLTHSFSDVVDAHFIGWRSKKIATDLEKAHPVKLVIQKFQNPDGALTKMREMLDAIKEHAQSKNNIHHCSGIQLSQNELSVTLMPVLDVENSKVKAIRHPSDQDWANAEKRMFEATGGRGTYQKSNVLRKQAIGAREFRVDRFGRRIEDK